MEETKNLLLLSKDFIACKIFGFGAYQTEPLASLI